MFSLHDFVCSCVHCNFISFFFCVWFVVVDKRFANPLPIWNNPFFVSLISVSLGLVAGQKHMEFAWVHHDVSTRPFHRVPSYFPP